MHVQPGGLLERLGLPAVFEVNSIHGQGIDVLAPGLRVEALAPDGLVEAISLDNGQGFSLAVQWHPEYQVMDNPQYLTLFQAFGAACRQRSLLRQNRKQPTAQRLRDLTEWKTMSAQNSQTQAWQALSRDHHLAPFSDVKQLAEKGRASSPRPGRIPVG